MTRFFSLWVIASSLAAAPPARETMALLARVGRRVETFSDEFAAVTCTERVTQAKLSPGGKLLVQKKSVYDYLMLMQLMDGELNVEESRIPRSVTGAKIDRPLLATAGFSTMLLVLHPNFQSSFEFTEGPEENGVGVIRFMHRKGGRSPSVLQLRSRLYPLEWKGTVWIDPATADVRRIHAELVAPMTDVGLQDLAIDVKYVPLVLAKQKFVLPESAEVEARTAHQHWRNVHVFDTYRRFSVEAEMKTSAPETPPEREK